MSTIDLLRRDAEVFGTNVMLFLFLPLALSLALTRASKWAIVPLAVATTIPAAWLAVYVLHLSRENGDNQMIAVGLTALASLAWLTLIIVSLGVVARRLADRSAQLLAGATTPGRRGRAGRTGGATTPR